MNSESSPRIVSRGLGPDRDLTPHREALREELRATLEAIHRSEPQDLVGKVSTSCSDSVRLIRGNRWL